MPYSDSRPIPYYSQMANSQFPFGSCNLTSLAMVLEYLGVTPRTSARFPDELIDYCESSGLDRHEADSLVKIASDYLAADNFRSNATIQQVKDWLNSPLKRAVILHGYFTASGHIIVLTGYDETGFWVNDPYGEWRVDGYDRNDDVDSTKGKQLHYSFGMVDRSCNDTERTGMWAHFLGEWPAKLPVPTK